jgi:tetratricopeptide (TPR) repeat protein
VYQERGLLYEQTKQYEKAVADYTKGMSLKKGNKSWIYWRRAYCYEHMGKIQEACGELKLVNDPINPYIKKEADKLAQLLKCQ